MCTETFLRLPEEKRSRFLEAAWEEFTRVKFADASINQIVRSAGIPRGSFYQYFADKEDLFAYLLQDVRGQFGEIFNRLLDQAKGDIFQMQLMAYDCAASRSGEPAALRDRFVRILQANPGMDLKRMLMGDPGQPLPRRFSERIDISRFRKQDPRFVRQVFFMTCMAMAAAVMDALVEPERSGEYRQDLEEQLEIMKRGSLRAVPERP